MRAFLLILAIAIPASHIVTSPIKTDLATHFDGFDGSFVMYDVKSQKTIRHNPARSAKRFSPCSTFKIPNALIALETGVANNASHHRDYQPDLYPKQSWMSDKLAQSWLRDHTLRSAFKRSAVWYFREQAKDIGALRMQGWLDRIGYGNSDISDGVDKFWLDSSLKISPNEQVEFLKALYHGELGFSKRSRQIVLDMMELEQGDDYRLLGKTGSDLKRMGWLVGILETDDNTYIYAYNAHLPKDLTAPYHRRELVKAIFRDLELIP